MNLKHLIFAILVIAFLGLQACTSPAFSESKINSQAEYQRRSERIANFLEERRKRLDVVSTTQTKSGQILDWIKPESQLPQGMKIEQTPPAQEPDLVQPENENG